MDSIEIRHNEIRHL